MIFFKAKKKLIIITFILLIGFFMFFKLAIATTRDEAYERLSLLAKVLVHIQNNYIETVDTTKLITGAIKGMVSTLDPHSAFLTPQEYRVMLGDTTGRFGGIGCEVQPLGGDLTVVSPIANSPAEKVGLRQGDKIIKIDDRITSNMSIEEAIRLLRGEPGSQVKLLIKRVDEAQPREIIIIRELISIEAVQSKILPENIGYIKIKIFQKGTVNKFRENINKLKLEARNKLKGIIIDLRDNPGGLFDEAVSLSDLFLSKGIIVTTRGRNGVILHENSATSEDTTKINLLLIVNQYTASAAEIFAGAMQDHRRAMIIGTKTYGKGSVQTLIEFPDGSALKLTIARYYTPSGRSIQAEGIDPDLIVEGIPPEKLLQPPEFSPTLEQDIEGHLANDSPPFQVTHLQTDDYQLRVAFDLIRTMIDFDF